jgi:hypothetical protein
VAGTWSRRSFLGRSISTLALMRAGGVFGQQAVSSQAASSQTGGSMSPWSAGFLDIHHINTGRGNSVFAICPDGTSLLIDAGAAGGSTEAMGPARPNDSRRPGEWIGRYALSHLKTTPRQELDYLVLTHLHGDHMGDVSPASPRARAGEYRLTGVTDVAEMLPVRRLIDRNFPDYSYPAPQTMEGALNYIKFAKFAAAHGTRVERIEVGSHSQITLQHDAAQYPSFRVQNLAANGRVWTGHGEEAVETFPDLKTLKPAEFPTENACSLALKISFGAFSYYIGCDLTADTRFGSVPWMDIESAVARVAGPTSVSALDHHGYFDGTGRECVRDMRSRVYVLQSWHASHPALSVLDELYSPLLAPGPHDVFATGLVEAAHLADARLSDKMLSQHGHVVIRVASDGSRFEVFVLDDTQEDGAVVSRWGPYLS